MSLTPTAAGTAAAGIPALPFTPIARPELYDRFDAAIAASNGHTLLVCAPAGSGKTVLIADWAAQHGIHHHRPQPTLRWLTMTGRSSGAAELRAALHRWLDDALPGAQHSGSGSNTAAAHHVLVIDNAHLITDPPALAYLEYVLAHLPPRSTTVLLARFAPPLHWHGLELNGRLSRLGTAELAFTDSEVAQLFRQQGCALTGAELATVLDLTRGWAALVAMAAHHVCEHPDRPAALALLARVPEPLADFLIGEFIAPLPASIRRFVLDTSIPDAFTTSLAEQLTGRTAHQMLDGLLRINFPITHEVRGGELWFGYHPMLATQLLAEVRRSRGGTVPEVHRRAAKWYVAMDMPLAALAHVRAGPDADLRSFLRDVTMRIVLNGEGATLFEQLATADSVPADDAYLWALRAVHALEQREIRTAITCLELACERTPATGTIAPREWIVPLMLAATAGAALQSGVGLAEIRLPDDIPVTGRADIDSYVAIQVGTVLLARGEIDTSEEQFRHGAALAECIGCRQLELRAAVRLAAAAGIAGRVTVLRERAERAVEIAAAAALSNSAEMGQAAALAAFAAHLQGERPTGDRAGRRSRRSANDVGSARAGRHADVIGRLLAVDFAEDRPAAVTALHRSTVRLLRNPTPLPGAADLLLPRIVPVLLDFQQPRTVGTLIRRAGDVLGETAGVLLSRATAALYAGDPKSVLGLVEPLLAGTAPLHPLHLITARLLAATAYATLINRPAARTALGGALHCAAPDRIVRPFLDLPGTVDLLDAHRGCFGPRDEFAADIRRRAAVRRRTDRSWLTATELMVRNLPRSGSDRHP